MTSTPVLANTEEWWQSIPPELRPRKDQPFYHLFADIEYVAYVYRSKIS